MRKVFYIDRALLIISLTLFIIYFKNIEGIGTILIYSTFFTFNIYLNLLMNKVNKYKRESKMSFKEKLDCIPLILGKLLSIIQILLMGVYLENNGMNTILILFMFQSFLILDYSYIYKNQIIAIKSKPLDLKNISNLIVQREFLNQTYISVMTKSSDKSTYCLSKEEYKKLCSYRSV